MANWTFNGTVLTDETNGAVGNIAYTSLDQDFYTLLFTTLGLTATFSPDAVNTLPRAAKSSDDFITVQSSGISSLGDVTLTDSSGDLFDGDDSGLNLTTGGNIYLFSDLGDVDSTLGTSTGYTDVVTGTEQEGKVVFGVAADGSIAFVLYLEKTATTADGDDYKVEVVQFQAIDNPDSTDPNDPVNLNGILHISAEEGFTIGFGEAPSANVLWIAFGEGSDVQVIANGRNPNPSKLSDGDTTNTSQGGILDATLGTNSQGMTSPDALYFTYVTGYTGPIAGNYQKPGDFKVASNLNYTGVFTTNSASVTISQTVGSETQGMKLTAMKTDVETQTAFFTGLGLDVDPENTSSQADDLARTITGVRVIDFFTKAEIVAQAGVGTTTAGGVTVTVNADGTADITGFAAGMEIVFDAADHNRVLMEATSGNWDPGAFGFTESTTDPEPLNGVIFRDDGPSVDVSASGASLSHALDETVNPDGDGLANGGDTYAPGETADNNGDLDDVAATPTLSTAPLAAQAIGRLTTTAGEVAGLFNTPTVTFGADAAGDLDSDGRDDTLELVLSDDNPIATNLYVTALNGTSLSGLSAANRRVYLVQVSDTVIEGRIAGANGVLGTGGDDFVALRITLTNPDSLATATLSSEQFLPLVHANGALFDENLVMTLATGETLGLKLTVDAEDGDDDTATDSATVTLVTSTGGYLSFDDDGPRLVVAATTVDVIHDETPGLDAGDDDIAGNTEIGAQVTDTVAALFTGIVNKGNDPHVAAGSKDNGALGFATSLTALVGVTTAAFGMDGSAGAVFTFALGGASGSTVSGLSTTEGKAILLTLENGVIVGRVDADGSGTVNTTDAAAFAIAIDGATGVVHTAQYLSIAQGTVATPLNGFASYDEIARLIDGSVKIVVTLNDGDTDGVSQEIAVGDQIGFADDGPVLGSQNSVADAGSAAAPLVMASTTTASDTFTWNAGADGGALVFTDWTLVDGGETKAFPSAWETVYGDITASYSLNNTKITFTAAGIGDAPDTDLFEVYLTDTSSTDGIASYTFNVLVDLPILLNEVDLSGFPSGNPVETITLGTMSSATTITFDGILWKSDPRTYTGGELTELDMTQVDNRPDTPLNNVTKQDNLNRDTNGFGVFANASALMNNLEGMTSLTSESVSGIQFVLNQNGATSKVEVSVRVEDTSNPGTYEIHSVLIDPLKKGGQAPVDNVTIITSDLLNAGDWDGDGTIEGANEAGLIVLDTLQSFDKVTYVYTFPDGGSNEAVRIKKVNLIEQSFLTDLEFAFDIQGTDGDQDQTQVETFSVFVDGDGDGLFA